MRNATFFHFRVPQQTLEASLRESGTSNNNQLDSRCRGNDAFFETPFMDNDR